MSPSTIFVTLLFYKRKDSPLVYTALIPPYLLHSATKSSSHPHRFSVVHSHGSQVQFEHSQHLSFSSILVLLLIHRPSSFNILFSFILDKTFCKSRLPLISFLQYQKSYHVLHKRVLNEISFSVSEKTFNDHIDCCFSTRYRVYPLLHFLHCNLSLTNETKVFLLAIFILIAIFLRCAGVSASSSSSSTSYSSLTHLHPYPLQLHQKVF